MPDAETGLLPCPFCGSVAQLIPAVHDINGPYVECTNRDCEVCQNAGNYSTVEEAITAWNRRAPPIPADGRDAIRVRALEWQEVWAGANEDIPAWFACDPSGWNRQINFAGEVAVRSHADAPADKLAAKMAAVQAEYRDRVLSAIETGGSGRDAGKFKRGDRVRKTKGSSWQGIIVGEYSTALTPDGYAVESEREPGSVQIYPASAIETVKP